MTGSGKSSLIQWLLEHEKADRIFIFDRDDEWEHRLGIKPVATIKELGEAKGHIVIYAPPDEVDPDVAFDDFCWFIFEYAKVANQDTIIAVVDELHTYVTTYTYPTSYQLALTKGRKQGIVFIMATTQPNLIHNLVRANVVDIYCFTQADRNAVKFHEALGTFDDDLLGMAQLQFYHKRIGGGVTKHRIKFLKKGIDIEKIS